MLYRTHEYRKGGVAMISEKGPLTWFDSAGGPLLLLSRRYMHSWKGYSPAWLGRLGEEDWDDDSLLEDSPTTEEKTDYDRACAVAAGGYLGVLEVDGGQGVVLGDMHMSTAWWPMGETEGIFIRWMYGDDPPSLMQRLLPMADDIWTTAEFTMHIDQDPLYLFDSASPGVEEPRHLSVMLAEGEYAIDTAIAQPDSRTQLVLHRLWRL
jgi:hypothetical protein